MIVEAVPWRPERAARKGTETVGIRVDVQKVALQRQVKLAGGKWNPARRVWELRRDQALKLGLKERVEQAGVLPEEDRSAIEVWWQQLKQRETAEQESGARVYQSFCALQPAV